MPLNPIDSLGQIVTDMHRLHRHEIMSPAEYALVDAVRALAEAVMAIQAQARLAAERPALTAAERRRLDDETNAHAAIRKERG
jgi:hypothetical protein